MLGMFAMPVWQADFKAANLTCTHELDKNTAAHISFYQFSHRHLTSSS